MIQSPDSPILVPPPTNEAKVPTPTTDRPAPISKPSPPAEQLNQIHEPSAVASAIEDTASTQGDEAVLKTLATGDIPSVDTPKEGQIKSMELTLGTNLKEAQEQRIYRHITDQYDQALRSSGITQEEGFQTLKDAALAARRKELEEKYSGWDVTDANTPKSIIEAKQADDKDADAEATRRATYEWLEANPEAMGKYGETFSSFITTITDDIKELQDSPTWPLDWPIQEGSLDRSSETPHSDDELKHMREMTQSLDASSSKALLQLLRENTEDIQGLYKTLPPKIATGIVLAYAAVLAHAVVIPAALVAIPIAAIVAAPLALRKIGWKRIGEFANTVWNGNVRLDQKTGKWMAKEENPETTDDKQKTPSQTPAKPTSTTQTPTSGT